MGEPFIIETSIGIFEIELYHKHAPKACYNFSQLATIGYYNNTIFHRIIKDFMIQGGDPTGTGKGGESVFGGKFQDEITRDLKHVGAGILSMANAGPDSNNSQFFITTKKTPWLDNKHVVFGIIISGFEVVKKIEQIETDDNSKPLKDITISKCGLIYPEKN